MASSLEGVIPNTTVSIGAKDGKVRRLQGNPIVGSKWILDHRSILVTKVKEQKALKGELRLPV